MSRRKQGRGRRKPSAVTLYVSETRSIGLSLALVVPLFLVYEIAMLVIDAPVRNGAEMVVADTLGRLPAESLAHVRRGTLALLVAGTLVWLRRDPPRVARAHWVLLEALALAVVLGPLVGWMVGGVGLSAPAGSLPSAHPAWLPFLLSLGAGLWEEVVFRLVLLGGLAYLLGRLTPMPRRAALGVSIVTSALAFAYYHHAGDMGEPFDPGRFAYRGIAGTILGTLFAYRGFAVVVYMHVFYDVLCDLRGLAL